MCLLFCFEILTTNAVFPAILVFFKGVLLSLIQKRVSGNSRDVLLVFPPQSPFFQKHSRFVISLVFFFSSVFPFNIPYLFFPSTPFEIILSFCFFGSIFVAPFLSSFLLLSFQPVSCHPLLQSTLLSFLVVSLFYSSSLHDIVFRLGVSFFFFLLVFVWFSSDCCCHLFFITGNFIVCFSFCCFLLSKCGVGCFGFRLMTWEKVFSCAVLVGFLENG